MTYRAVLRSHGRFEDADRRDGLVIGAELDAGDAGVIIVDDVHECGADVRVAFGKEGFPDLVPESIVFGRSRRGRRLQAPEKVPARNWVLNRLTFLGTGVVPGFRVDRYL